MSQKSQWIGEDAEKASKALERGDYATVDACLQAIISYAVQLGYVPDTALDEEEEPGIDADPETFLDYWHEGEADGHWSSPHGCHAACPVCAGEKSEDEDTNPDDEKEPL